MIPFAYRGECIEESVLYLREEIDTDIVMDE